MKGYLPLKTAFTHNKTEVKYVPAQI